LDELHLKYMEKVIRPMMTQKAQDLVNQHQTAGDLCVVITATNSFVTKPIATAYGIEHLIGTDPEMVNGEYTGGVSGVPSFQEGKVTRINQWLAERGTSLADYETSYFYSDSHNDLPLMKLVTNPVAVDADEILTDYAKQQGWPRITLR
jgi:HAD superfamily hydrolase (TIGR01490 family)